MEARIRDQETDGNGRETLHFLAGGQGLVSVVDRTKKNAHDEEDRGEKRAGGGKHPRGWR